MNDYFLRSMIRQRHEQIKTEIRSAQLSRLTTLLSPDYLGGKPDGGPLLTGLIFDYGAGNDIGTSWKYHWATWHAEVDGALRSGEVVTIEREPGANDCPATRIATWAVPLLSITDAESLKRNTADVFGRWA